MSDFTKILSIIWGKDNKARLLILLSMTIVYGLSIALVFIPVIFKRAIDFIQINLSSNNQFSGLLMFLLFAYGIGWTICEVLIMVRPIITSKVMFTILVNIISGMVNKFIDLDFVRHANKKTGEIISIIERLQIALPQFIDGLLVQILPVFLQILVAIIIVYKSFGLSYSLLLLAMVTFCLVMNIVNASQMIKYRVESNAKQNQFSNYLLDTLQQYDAIKYFNNQNYEKQQIKSLLISEQDAQIKLIRKICIAGASQAFMIGMGLVAVTVKSGYDVINHQMSLGSFVLLNSYMLQFSLPLSSITYVIQGVKRSFVDIREFINLSDKITTDNDIIDDIAIIDKPDIEFKNVSCFYQDKEVLSNISFKIKHGQTVAILGKTGAGKSTITRLLFKFIKPSSGEILIGNRNIETISEHNLIKLFGIVPQDLALFNRSLIDNIRYGNLDASDQKISEVLNLLNLNHLKDRELLGERSVKISGGEKQRIAIARVLLKNSPICVFDEFTSNLDGQTEKMILNIVDSLFKGKTKIMIAHKLNTITNADQIIFINNGKIIDIGSHDDLISRNDSYKKQWDIYAKSNVLAQMD